MKLFLKYGSISIAIISFLLMVTLVLLPVFLNVQHYVPEIEKKLSEVTGRQFSIGSDLNLSLFPWISLSFSDLQLSSPQGFAKTEFFKIRTFEARIKLLPLLKKQISISRFVVGGLELNLERLEDGRGNWQFSSKDAGNNKLGQSSLEKTVGAAMEHLNFGVFAVTDGRITWNDKTNQSSHEISDFVLLLNNVTYKDYFNADFRANIDGRPLSLEGKVGPLDKFSGQGRLDLDLQVGVFGDQIAILKGYLKSSRQQPRYNFRLEIPSFSVAKLLAKIEGVTSATITGAEYLPILNLEMRLKGNRQQVTVNDGVIQAGGSRVDFSVSIDDFDTPEIKFVTNIDSLDISNYFTAKENISSEKDPDQVIVDQISAMGLLNRIKLDGLISVGEIKSGDRAFSEIEIPVAGSGGKFMADPISLSVGQGRIVSKVVLDALTDSPQLSIRLAVDDVQGESLLKGIFAKEFLTGSINADISMNASGGNMVAIKSSLSGSGEFQVRDGSLVGHEFSELTSSITIAGGVISSRSAELKSADARMLITGTADLVSSKLDFTMIPQDINKAGDDGTDVTKGGNMPPVVVSGTFTEIKIISDDHRETTADLQLPDKRIDVEQLVDEKLPSPAEEDVKNLVGKSLIDPIIVAQRFGLQPVKISQTNKKKKFRPGTGRIHLSPLQQQSFLQL